MLSAKISPTVTEAMAKDPTGFGWQIVHYPRRNWIIVNVPNDGVFAQHAMHLVTGAWGIWRLQAQCWSLFNDDMMFGHADGSVRAFDQGALERAPTLELSEGLVLRVIDLPTLIELKEKAGRPKDLAVLPVLLATLVETQRRS